MKGDKKHPSHSFSLVSVIGKGDESADPYSLGLHCTVGGRWCLNAVAPSQNSVVNPKLAGFSLGVHVTEGTGEQAEV